MPRSRTPCCWIPSSSTTCPMRARPSSRPGSRCRAWTRCGRSACRSPAGRPTIRTRFRRPARAPDPVPISFVLGDAGTAGIPDPCTGDRMTLTATDLILDASGIEKSYGAVVALKAASLAVRPGEVHALMGANGAGKSTLVKILTGGVRPAAGRITVRGRERTAHPPADARRNGLVSVYQEPSLIPDLDIRSNLRLTQTPVEPFRHWLAELGLPGLDLSMLARELPLASLRI